MSGYKKLLCISQSAWDDANSTGNTISNLFADWSSDNIANIYCRTERPRNKICNRYFRVCEKDLLRSLIAGEPAGKEFAYNEQVDAFEMESARMERRLLDVFRNIRWAVFLFLRELIWKSGKWKGDKLDSFLDNFAPDVIFSFGLDALYMHDLLFYCKERTKAKLVLFFVDDIYGYKTFSPMMRLYQGMTRSRICKAVGIASRLYGVTRKICDEYGTIFGKEFRPLYKGCDFAESHIKTNVAYPLRIVYAGNVLYGRWKTLGMLARMLNHININGVKAKLEIYTQNRVTKQFNSALNVGESSRIIGGISYEEVKEVLREADIVLHVESFDKKERMVTRLSFSTKIIDCMQSGSCMMAIGPLDVASMEYLVNSGVALTATNKEELEKLLQLVIDDPQILSNYAAKMNAYARKNHEINNVREMLRLDCEKLLSEAP